MKRVSAMDQCEGRIMAHRSGTALHSDHFILQAFDRDLWCPIAQTLFHVGDIGALRSILDVVPDEDPELRGMYRLDDAELEALTARFGVKIDPSLRHSANLEIGLFRWRRLSAAQRRPLGKAGR
jgi:hypothetical protein